MTSNGGCVTSGRFDLDLRRFARRSALPEETTTTARCLATTIDPVSTMAIPDRRWTNFGSNTGNTLPMMTRYLMKVGSEDFLIHVIFDEGIEPKGC